MKWVRKVEPRHHRYGVQVRVKGDAWQWVDQGGAVTGVPKELWSGPYAEAFALEAARGISTRHPAHTFRVQAAA